MLIHLTKLLAITFFLLSFNAIAEQKTVVVFGKAVIADGKTLNQARNQALNQARSLAIEQASGVSVTSSLLMKNALVVSEFVKTLSHGFLIEETVLDWQGDWVKTTNFPDLGLPVVVVKIAAKVETPEKTFFHNYALQAKLNKSIFRSGESAILEISNSEDMYILVVNYTSDNKIIPVFPFSEASNNFLKKDSHLILPSKQTADIDIVVSNYPRHKKDTEAFIVMGVAVNESTKNINWSDKFKPDEEISYPNYFGTLLELPISWIAEKTLVYSVFAD